MSSGRSSVTCIGTSCAHVEGAPMLRRQSAPPTTRMIGQPADHGRLSRTMRAAMTPPLQPVSVAQYGIGPIGAEIARLLLTKKWVRLVAAVDIDPNKVGK